MNRSLSSRFAAAALFATAALGAATAAQARTDIQFSIGIPARPVYAEPGPAYFRPVPVYVQPRPVYVPPPAFVYERDWRPSYPAYERERAWRHAEWRRRQWERRHHHDGDRFRPHGREWD